MVSRVRTRHHHDFLAVACYGGLQPCEGCDRRRGALVSARGPFNCSHGLAAGEEGTRYGNWMMGCSPSVQRGVPYCGYVRSRRFLDSCSGSLAEM